MSDREKLIELMEGAKNSREIFCSTRLYCSELIADHLISNGVTVGVDTKPLKQYLTQIDEYAGLKLKFLVFKADTGERIENCFVLRPDKDHAAVEALRAYAEATDNKTLADDIYNWVGNGVTVKKWISVSEPPKKYGKYLVVCENINTAVIRLFEGEWDSLQKVTHWMPLPEPPKECE